MKRLARKGVNASRVFDSTDTLFTAEDVVNLLSEIEDLKNNRIKLITESDGLKFVIDDYEYQVSSWYANVGFLTIIS